MLIGDPGPTTALTLHVFLASRWHVCSQLNFGKLTVPRVTGSGSKSKTKKVQLGSDEAQCVWVDPLSWRLVTPLTEAEKNAQREAAAAQGAATVAYHAVPRLTYP